MLGSVDETLLDRGARDAAAAVERLCVVTRKVKPTDELMRFVAGPDGTIVPDLKRRLPGRGVWVTAERMAVSEAVRRNLFARSLKAEVKALADLPEQVAQMLERHALDALAIAQKASQVVHGFTKVEASLASGDVAGLMMASDASPDGVRKLVAVMRRAFGDDADRIPIVRTFTSQQLDLALGRSNVIHAALLAGSAAQGFLDRWRRLERFMSTPGDGRTNGTKATREGAD